MRHYEKDYPGWPGQELIERALRAMQRIANRINEIKKVHVRHKQVLGRVYHVNST